ncbi:MAG: DNA repair ATPase [Planctomycetota bacterium]
MSEAELAGGTYEILRNRLRDAAKGLRERVKQLNDDRGEVFGNVETRLVATHRVNTEHNCVPRDLVAIGSRFLLGYNVQFGLKTEIDVPDVLAVHRLEDQAFHAEELGLIDDARFRDDFAELYRFYKNTTFARFFVNGPMLHMVFQVGKTPSDIKSFKWRVTDDGLEYLDNRSDHEVKLPRQHAFNWVRATRDMHHYGDHPHISIEDRVFVETVGGDLTVKVENNTASGEGIYAEPVDNPDQKLDDADIAYSVVGDLILLKIKPYQEDTVRYLVFNGKLNQVVRLDEIQHACVMLPGDQGLVFPGGYYLQSGEFKRFDHGLIDMRFERSVAAANGEDHLYLFSHASDGTYIQLRYNQIRQTVDTPLICHGQTIFKSGEMAVFRAQESAQKHHTIQIWQTPFIDPAFAPESQTDSYLFKIGNKELVQAMAECSELLHLIDREETYDGLYDDLTKKSSDILDSYFWIAQGETHRLDEPLHAIRDAAAAAVDEFEKVVRLRQATENQTSAAETAIANTIKEIERSRFESIDDFVGVLSTLRRLRGQAIALREQKYVDDQRVDVMETTTAEHTDRVSRRCVTFLLSEDALSPYQTRIAEAGERVESVATVATASSLSEEIDQAAADLEMLTETVSNLQIDDATQRTEIIDGIGDVFASVNRVRAALKNRREALVGEEGRAEFASQMKLLQQTTAGYLDVCDTPVRCDEYLTKVMVQLEEIEGRFAEFDEFVETLAERRQDIYTAFETRKVALVEKRNRRAESLTSAAGRILSGIRSRVGSMDSVDEIAAYFAGDLMVAKVRDIVGQLEELDDAVRVGDLQSQLKVIQEDALRGLKDRQDLFEEGGDVIRLGKHRFAVNTQPLDLTTVLRDGALCLHLTGTQYFAPMSDPRLEAARDLWDQSLVSESKEVYRAEYLAMDLLDCVDPKQTIDVAWVNQQAAGRFDEGYAKGVHDEDAAQILKGLLELQSGIGLLQHQPDVRAAGWLLWKKVLNPKTRAAMGHWIAGFAKLAKAYPNAEPAREFRARLIEIAHADFSDWWPIFGVDEDPADAKSFASDMAAYLFDQLTTAPQKPTISGSAAGLLDGFLNSLSADDRDRYLQAGIKANNGDVLRSFVLARNWADAFLESGRAQSDATQEDPQGYRNELAWLILQHVESSGKANSTPTPYKVSDANASLTVAGVAGGHARVKEGVLPLHYHDFHKRLRHHRESVVPRFRALHTAKGELIDAARDDMRLDEFKPQVLSSFVRNRLLDEVYLPLIGDNLAKQMGSAGEDKRTDRMGLLLLISPPGYGKTTLMEYIASRLGLVFMKINGPAIGHEVTSLDPSEAPNAAAREEIERLNLALEMGDNVMLYLDDIQHTNPELLQKFISLCDATRKIEGVHQGRTRTYDLRGRRVAVVMAGNPYTESGERFQIPDMLSNRADVYNLGEVVGESAEAFEISYLENGLTSNPILAPLAMASPDDARRLISAAQRDSMEGADLESKFSMDQLRDMFEVLRKLLRVRDVVLKVNRAYIRSAAQADAYRTEPPFKLQGSYRNMNRIAEKVVPVMNDDELQSLIVSSYEQDAQTLTTDNEANVLKFKELMGILSSDEQQRWESIKYAFVESIRMAGLDSDDQAGQLMRQLASMRDGLESIRQVIAKAIAMQDHGADDRMDARVDQLRHSLSSMGDQLAQRLSDTAGRLETLAEQQVASPPEQKYLVQHKVPRVMADLLKGQFHLMQEWMRPMLTEAMENGRDLERLQQQVDSLLNALNATQDAIQPDRSIPE